MTAERKKIADASARPKRTKAEIITGLIADARTFRFCGPSDDPDEQTAVTSGYRYLVIQLKRLAGPILPEEAATRLNTIDVQLDSIGELDGRYANNIRNVWVRATLTLRHSGPVWWDRLSCCYKTRYTIRSCVRRLSGGERVPCLGVGGRLSMQRRGGQK
jgi:hypothetical protein